MNINSQGPVTELSAEQAPAYEAASENESLVTNNLKFESMKKEKTGKPEEQVSLGEVCNVNSANTNIKYLLSQADQEFCNKAVNEVIARLEPSGLAAPAFNISIINLTGAEKAGLITVAKLKMNRYPKDKAIEKIMESIQDCGQQILVLAIPGRVAKKYGYSLVRFDGTEIPEGQIEEAIGLVDGQSRYSAYQKLLKENPSMAAPDLFAYFPLCWVALDEMLKSINLKVFSWRNSDYMTGVLSNRAITDKTKEALMFIQKLEADGYNYTAACEWLTLDKGIIRKTPLVKAMSSNESSLEFDKAEFGMQLCGAAQGKFKDNFEAVLKSKVFPELVISKWNAACKELTQPQATELMKDFFKNLTEKEIQEIAMPSEYKRGCGRKREEFVVEHFEESFTNFLSKRPYSTFKKV